MPIHIDTINEDALLDQSIVRFLKNEYTWDKRQSAIAQSTDMWRQFAELGWLGLPFNEKDGGLSGSLKSLANLSAAFGRSLVTEPYLSGVVLSGLVFAAMRPSALRHEYLEGLISGNLKVATVHCEMGSKNRVALTRSVDGNYELNGVAPYVSGSAATGMLIVAANVSESSDLASGLQLLTLGVHMRDIAGVLIQPYRGFDDHPSLRVSFTKVKVFPDQILSLEQDASLVLSRALTLCCALSCSEAVGVLSSIFQQTVEYAHERKQFGRPLVDNQAIAHRLVEMGIELHDGAAMAQLAIEMFETGTWSEQQEATSMAKLRISQSLKIVAEAAVQIHGAIATTSEFATGHYFKRATALRLLYGDATWHENRLTSRFRASAELVKEPV